MARERGGIPSETLVLFSVVDDRSGVSCQEYRCVHGEETIHGTVNARVSCTTPSGPT